MQLAHKEQSAISDTIHQTDADAIIYLFGSRADDTAKGGDIELTSITAEIERKTMQLTAKLQLRIGDQPIDVLVLDPSTPRQSIHEQASMTGISL